LCNWRNGKSRRLSKSAPNPEDANYCTSTDLPSAEAFFTDNEDFLGDMTAGPPAVDLKYWLTVSEVGGGFGFT
jgi:hypothetical protein